MEFVAIMTHRDEHGASSFFVGTFTTAKVAWAAILASEIFTFGFRDWHKLVPDNPDNPDNQNIYSFPTQDVVAWAIHQDTHLDSVRTLASAMVDYRNEAEKNNGEFSYYTIIERTAGAWDGPAVLAESFD